MESIYIQGKPELTGTKKAVVSEWIQADGSIRYVMKPITGGRTKICKTREGALKSAERYTGQ